MLLWPTAGSANTSATLEAALTRAKELSLENIVVASCSGKTAALLIGCGLNVVCVTHHVGFLSPGSDEMAPEMRERLRHAGIKVLTTTHLMAGLDRSLRLQVRRSLSFGDYCGDAPHSGAGG